MRFPITCLILATTMIVAFIIGLSRDPKNIPSNLINTLVPVFKLDVIGGNIPSFDKEDLLMDRDVKLVNVFASWCPPCKIEHAQLSKLSQEYNIYGINHKDDSEKLFQWLKENGNPYSAIGADYNGRASIDWGVYGVPETFILDKNSMIRYQHIGPIMKRDLENILSVIRLLKNEK